MTEFQKFLGWSAVANSALYLGLVVVAGLVTHNPFAWKLGLAAFGLTYIGYHCQYLSGAYPVAAQVGQTAVWCSIIAGLLAGAALLLKS